jgi:hypothetical protein
MLKISFKPAWMASLLAVVTQGAFAEPLSLEVKQTLNGQQYSQTLLFSSFDTMVNTYKTADELKSAITNWSYNSKEASTATMNNLGIKFYFNIGKFENGLTTVTLDAPGTSLRNKAYADTSQDKALSRMKEDIKAQYSSVQTALAKTTPNSLTAGNPTSVQSQMASAQFDQGFTASSSQIVSSSAIASATTATTSSSTTSSASSTGPTASASSSSGSSSSDSSSSGSSSSSSTASSSSSSSSSGNTAILSGLVGMGLRVGQYKQGDIKTQTITLPLSYTWRFDEDERRHVTLAAPLTVGKMDQAKVFNAQLGIAVGIPVTEQWALTPAIGYGVAGSVDLAQAAQQVSASLTSAYVMVFDNGQSLAMGNMAGYYTTVKMKIDEYTSNPNISNIILRNGLMYSLPLDVDVVGNGITTEFSVINTHYLGTDLFVKTSNDFGITLGTNKRVKGATRYLRAGLSVTRAKGASGFGANIGYWF